MPDRLLAWIFLALFCLSISSGSFAQSSVFGPVDSYSVVSVGFGHANAEVIPNPDNLYFDDNGLSLGFGLGAEKPLTNALALTARLDLFNSFDFSTLISDADSSWGGMLTAGVVLGNVSRPGQVYLSATAGFGFAVLSDQGRDEEGNSICILCSGREGGSSAGLSSRLAIGFTARNSRIELVWLRAGGNGNNGDYPNDEDAFLDAIQVQVSSRGIPH